MLSTLLKTAAPGVVDFILQRLRESPYSLARSGNRHIWGHFFLNKKNMMQSFMLSTRLLLDWPAEVLKPVFDRLVYSFREGRNNQALSLLNVTGSFRTTEQQERLVLPGGLSSHGGCGLLSGPTMEAESKPLD